MGQRGTLLDVTHERFATAISRRLRNGWLGQLFESALRRGTDTRRVLAYPSPR